MRDLLCNRLVLFLFVLSVCAMAGAQEIVSDGSAAAVVPAAAVIPEVAAGEGTPAGGKWSAEITLKSRDIWRGIADGAVTGENAVTYERGPWEVCTTLVFEGALPEENHNHAEVDLEITRHIRLRRGWSLVAGYQYYGTPHEEYQHAHEFWAGAEYEGRVDFSLKAYQFAAPHRGSYFSAEAGRTVYTRGRFSLRGESLIGFNRHMLVAGAGFSDMAFTVIPAIRIPRGSLQPFFTFSKTLNNQWFGNEMAFGMSFLLGKAE